MQRFGTEKSCLQKFKISAQALSASELELASAQRNLSLQASEFISQDRRSKEELRACLAERNASQVKFNEYVRACRAEQNSAQAESKEELSACLVERHAAQVELNRTRTELYRSFPPKKIIVKLVVIIKSTITKINKKTKRKNGKPKQPK